MTQSFVPKEMLGKPYATELPMSETDPVAIVDAAGKILTSRLPMSALLAKEPVRMATASALPACAYANGTSGVGQS